MNNQQVKINQLLELIQENPKLPIIPMVRTDVCNSDDYNYWAGSWQEARLDEIWDDGDRFNFKLFDYEYLVEKVIDNNIDEWESCPDKLKEEMACDIVDKYEWKKCIVVKIDLPE